MNSLSFSAAKSNLGNIFIAGPQAKAGKKKPKLPPVPCDGKMKKGKCIARKPPPPPRDDDNDE